MILPGPKAAIGFSKQTLINGQQIDLLLFPLILFESKLITIYSIFKDFYSFYSYSFNILFALPDLKSSLVAVSASLSLKDSIRNWPVR